MPDTNPKLLLITWTIYFALYTCNAALLWLSFVAHLSKTREIALTQTKLDLAIAEARSAQAERSEEHTSELQSLMRISYAVFCLKKTTTKYKQNETNHERN